MEARLTEFVKEFAMNHVFFEEKCREKVQDFLTEGMTSQEFYRTRTDNQNQTHAL